MKETTGSVYKVVWDSSFTPIDDGSSITKYPPNYTTDNPYQEAQFHPSQNETVVPKQGLTYSSGKTLQGITKPSFIQETSVEYSYCQHCKKRVESDEIYTDYPCSRRCLVCKLCFISHLSRGIRKCPRCERNLGEEEIEMISVYKESLSPNYD